jgi:hypothetical protein
MLRKLVIFAAAALAIGALVPSAIPQAGAGEARQGDLAAPSPSGYFGPYATMRRANEVANYFRSLGYSAIAFHNGDGYYVRVW